MAVAKRKRHARTKRRSQRKRGRTIGRRQKRTAQRGGADLPKGYEDVMAVSYTPTSDKLGDPDMVPRIGGVSAFYTDTDAKGEVAVADVDAEPAVDADTEPAAV